MKKKEGLPLERVAAVLFDPHGEAQPSSAELAAGGCFMKMSERGHPLLVPSGWRNTQGILHTAERLPGQKRGCQ